jgi:hypothetical protein
VLIEESLEFRCGKNNQGCRRGSQGGGGSNRSFVQYSHFPEEISRAQNSDGPLELNIPLRGNLYLASEDKVELIPFVSLVKNVFPGRQLDGLTNRFDSGKYLGRNSGENLEGGQHVAVDCLRRKGLRIEE